MPGVAYMMCIGWWVFSSSPRRQWLPLKSSPTAISITPDHATHLPPHLGMRFRTIFPASVHPNKSFLSPWLFFYRWSDLQGNSQSNDLSDDSPADWITNSDSEEHKRISLEIQDQPRSEEKTHQAYNDNGYHQASGVSRTCSDSNTTKTPLWRSGPQGGSLISLSWKMAEFRLIFSLNGSLRKLHFWRLNLIDFASIFIHWLNWSRI